MGKESIAIVVTGVALFLQKLIGDILWSIILYLNRGELNHDNNENTMDKYLHYNPNLGTFTTKYVEKYTPKGVHTGFFWKGKWVAKFYFWLDWAKDKSNRFPWPIDIEEGTPEEAALNLLKRRK